MNQFFLSGRIANTPDVRISPTPNKSVAHFSLASKRDYSSVTDYFTFTAFGNKAEFIKKYLHKGMQVYIKSRIQNNIYEKDGKKVYDFDFIVEEIEIPNK
ncbi:MAG: single-stranded DNA-binding protein [Eubacterium sp.]